ncbi:hypothetical protein F4815DRAFT_443650 [Daldinia loculata]|uniref:uncharacterized protein n=1 Tax=Daldinia loculata TaxID=103429 RepID=UPI0020C581F2|nr:uncharacterized protein F4817DRAFT_163824 [Daldinia loculata]KAI1645837.1 hypothetical protein F4817DRAFT_163824 [Daldinia loculata]KAI2782192.1 hypothetical protein F4815DRAFT_443650 [Daldinia loculata]
MSRFAVYCDWIATARKCLNGEQPPRYIARFYVRENPVRFPLAGVEPSNRVAQFYEELLAEVEQSRLRDRRKKLYRQFVNRVIAAHAAVEDAGVPLGTVSMLRNPLAHLDIALNRMADLIEYDNEHPIHWSEVFPIENTKSQLSPSELWLHFKLESIRPCLVFLVRLLGLVLPKYSDMWRECDESLTSTEWIAQFILDSPRAPRESPSARRPGIDLSSQQANPGLHGIQLCGSALMRHPRV